MLTDLLTVPSGFVFFESSHRSIGIKTFSDPEKYKQPLWFGANTSMDLPSDLGELFGTVNLALKKNTRISD